MSPRPAVRLRSVAAVLLVTVVATACFPTTYVAESGLLGVHVDSDGVAWLVWETCEGDSPPESIRLYSEGEDYFESSLISEYLAPDDVASEGPSQTPLFDLDEVGYTLESGAAIDPDDLPFRVLVRGLGLSTIVRDLPEPGTTVYFDVRTDEHVTVAEAHPSAFRCP